MPPVSGAPLDSRPVVLIPAYKPEAVLPQLVRELAASPQIQGVIVVNDGSGEAYEEVFRSLAGIENLHLIRHVVNLGKGAALKNGLNYAACTFSGSVGVVTADADGQHGVEDILHVAGALVARPRRLILGCRSFDTVVPFRSRFGNTLTRYIMRVVTGQKLADTQTGLRGIPMDFVPDLVKLRATGYDFELDMLVTCRHTGWQVWDVPISTIYIDDNRSSHFNPLLDSMRIYFVFVRFLAVSLSAAGIDNVVFILSSHFLPDILLCQVAGRLVAGTFQFTAGRLGVFHSKARTAVAFPKYWLLVFLLGALSYLLIRNIMAFTGVGVVPAKLSAETILFFFSFVLQRDFVFAQKEASET
jgi:glycosyltransferase involved in cell wall biosynthesis